MKVRTIPRRLMILSAVCEGIYLLLITVIYIFRPPFYSNALIAALKLDLTELPPNRPDIALTIAIYGVGVLYFILWFVLKIVADRDKEPIAAGVVTFLALLVSSELSGYMYRRAFQKTLNDIYATIRGMTSDREILISFYSANITVLSSLGWLHTAAFIFMLMACAADGQRLADHKKYDASSSSV